MNIRRVVSFLITLVFLGACKSTNDVVLPSGGVIEGKVALVSPTGDTLPSYANAKVQIEGTSFETTSNATGNWQINNVLAGIYNVIISKPGFDTLIIPQFECKGVGTAFLLNSAIQQLPLDSLVYTVSNIVEDSTISGYLGLLSMSGYVSGPDSLQLAQGVIVASGEIGQSPTADITNGQISNLNNGAIGYNVPPHNRGGLVEFQSFLYANGATADYTYFQRATSPYVIVRTFRLP